MLLKKTCFNRMGQTCPWSTLLTFLIVWSCQLSYAHSGSICYAYAMEPVTIDGDLSDWPVHIQRVPFDFYANAPKTGLEIDNYAEMRAGYNTKTQSLYIALELIDDDFVRNPEKPLWNLHDGQVLYLDADHDLNATGVTAYEINLDTQKIVHQKDMPWFEDLQQASWENVELKINRKGKKTIYEWRIDLGDHVKPGHTIGFDYLILDKDTDQGTKYINWGRGQGMKHANSKILGDLVFVPEEATLYTIEGQVRWAAEGEEKLPPTVRFTADNKNKTCLETPVDSSGHFSISIFPGKYHLSVPDELVFLERSIYRVAMETPVEVSVAEGLAVPSPSVVITRVADPDLIPEKGLLHDFDEEKAAHLDQFIRTYQKHYAIPGVSLALIKDGKLCYHKTYGVQNNVSRETVKEHSLFEAASVTKPVFAYTVNRLVEKGVIDLDKPLYEYLPFEALEKYDYYKKMTGRHVLKHESGLPNWGVEMIAEPGTKFGYSGEGFEYLKRVVAKITGKNIEQVVAEEVIKPMRLYNIHFSENETLKKTAVSGHYNAVPSIHFWPSEAGMAWSMFTESKAFTRFAIGLLERRGLKPETYKTFLEMYNEAPLDEGEEERAYARGMGLGIAVRESPYGPVFGHGGNNGDFQCEFEVYQDLKMGYVVFTNADTGYAMLQHLAKLLVEGKDKSLVSK